jgi:prophage antirepressor-like protein
LRSSFQQASPELRTPGLFTLNNQAMMLTIKNFENGQFGHLTSLKSEKTGKVMFIAKEVCDLWGHTNSRKAIKDAQLKSDEVLVIQKKGNENFFSEPSNHQLLGHRSSSVQLVSESGLYKLALNSKKAEANQLKHWIATEVLPSLRQTGKFVMQNTVTSIGEHSSVPVQKNNSRDINRVNYQNGGVPEIVEYNTKSCLAMTGFKPKEIKDSAKKLGLKSCQRTSAKEVLRHTRPEVACTMSFIDNAVKQGQSFEKFVEIGKKYAAPLFKAMLESGMRPGELSM